MRFHRAVFVGGLMALLGITAGGCAPVESSTAGKPGPAIAAGLFYPATFTLKNGMDVIVVPNHRAPVVIHQVWYRTGAADDAPGHAGLAHYLEHLMFKGTKRHPGGTFSRLVSSHGGHDNAFTSYDTTTYTQTVPADRLELVMSLGADRMAGLHFPVAQGLTERDVVLSERRERTDDEPSGRLWEQMRKALYGVSPYGRPVIGTAEEIKGLTPALALERHKKNYAPNNAILVVSGDVEPQKVLKLAEKTYGRLPRRFVPPRDRARDPMDRTARPAQIKVCDAGLRQASWQRWGRAPKASDPRSAAFEVLADILGGGRTSRLYRRLVMEDKIATGASASYQGEAWDEGMMTLSVSPMKDSLGKIDAVMAEETARLVRDGVTAQETAEAIERLKRMGILARDDVTDPAQVLGLSVATGQSVADVESWPARIAAVTPEQVQQAAKDVFGRTGGWVTGWLLPQEQCAQIADNAAQQEP